MSRFLLKDPSAFLPLAMSVLALVTVAVHVARFGPAPQPDEGAAAHIWQLLMSGQAPIVALFAIRRIPHAPQQALVVLALQAAAAAAAMAPVFVMRW